MRKGQTKDYYIKLCQENETKIREILHEKSRLQQQLYALMVNKDSVENVVRQEVDEKWEQEVSKIRDDYEEQLQEMSAERDAERRQFLNALGIDEMEWSRISWKF